MIHLDGGVPWGTVNAAQSKALVQFCLRRSRYIMLSRVHREKIDGEILEKLKQEAVEEVRQRSRRQIKYIKTLSPQQLEKDGFLSLDWGIDNITTNAKREIRELQQVRCRFKEEDTLEADLREWGLVKRDFGLCSFTTYVAGAIWDLCYFDQDQIDLTRLRKDIFAYPLYVGGYEFEDPVFVDGAGLACMRICSHEREFTMKLTEEDYQEFKEMNIRHVK